MGGRTHTWVGPSYASTREVMLGMGLRAGEVRTSVKAKRAAKPAKTTVVRTAKKGATSAELPRPPTSKKRTLTK